MQSRHVSCVINSDCQRVYDFVVDPDNLPRWALGLAQAPVQRDEDDLVVASPMGDVRVRFVPRNEYGVVDHDVTLPSGAIVNNPMRVLKHPEGCEVVFTLRQHELTDGEFDQDCRMVANDLARLRQLLEV
jgi:uncharacterized protein YndB with AHSA1/START domain